MRVKDFLVKIRHVDMLIDCKCDQLTELRNRLTSISSSLGERVQLNNDEDKFATSIANIIELENEINEDIDHLIELKRTARKAIERLDEDVEKMVLYKRYFDNKTFEQISVEMNYSWRRICQIHGNALQNLERLHIIS